MRVHEPDHALPTPISDYLKTRVVISNTVMMLAPHIQ